MRAIILSAGKGTRLGSANPKPLLRMDNGKRIMEFQIENLLHYVSIHDIYVVVGFKKELIMESFQDLIYIYNNFYDSTNTASSLLKALKKINDEDVLWINGDVVFDRKIIEKLLQTQLSSLAVHKCSVGEEEVKYLVDSNNFIQRVSKEVKDAEGEALGINLCKKADLEKFKQALILCQPTDFFEKGIEIAIQKYQVKFPAVEISPLFAIDIDFPEDLKLANHVLASRL